MCGDVCYCRRQAVLLVLVSSPSVPHVSQLSDSECNTSVAAEEQQWSHLYPNESSVPTSYVPIRQYPLSAAGAARLCTVPDESTHKKRQRTEKSEEGAGNKSGDNKRKKELAPRGLLGALGPLTAAALCQPPTPNPSGFRQIYFTEHLWLDKRRSRGPAH
ncbi:hypothetical protein Q8A73_009492 [Channa argus]|nr:hypothetical protein Q8A73_009492 [Channa argus]